MTTYRHAVHLDDHLNTEDVKAMVLWLLDKLDRVEALEKHVTLNSITLERFSNGERKALCISITVQDGHECLYKYKEDEASVPERLHAPVSAMDKAKENMRASAARVYNNPSAWWRFFKND